MTSGSPKRVKNNNFTQDGETSWQKTGISTASGRVSDEEATYHGTSQEIPQTIPLKGTNS
jgi:hypothetical protein